MEAKASSLGSFLTSGGGGFGAKSNMSSNDDFRAGDDVAGDDVAAVGFLIGTKVVGWAGDDVIWGDFTEGADV